MAMLAWLGPEEFAQPRSKAAAFLLLNTGHHPQPDPKGVIKHNTALRGWPWAAGSHSWVEPTAMAVLALQANGHADHPRVSEAVRMLMDRRLDHGGWNYGNTVVFGAELDPMPDATGMALAALQGMVSRDDIQSGLDYLLPEFNQCLTPQTFSWGRLGLAAWGVPIGGIDQKVNRILDRQARLGSYDTSALGQLLVALNAPEGIMGLVKKMNRGAI
ncbi:MAG: hypothetical protein KMY53_18430 [Desulfarculus sp.]|nr:hypothetical protein [Pseudomonadota bacterium]MBU4599946.1 hypothetical protein [Pseudomonadota bacterium]MBV1714610.1 hypothetical protein [Desulfarculus sp.]MBV1740147.1 hypothetical protein [Desulfarculus sp.]